MQMNRRRKRKENALLVLILKIHKFVHDTFENFMRLTWSAGQAFLGRGFTFKQVSQSPTVSFMLVEDMRLMVLRQKNFLLMAQRAA